jgi:hypothetical protein
MTAEQIRLARDLFTTAELDDTGVPSVPRLGGHATICKYVASSRPGSVHGRIGTVQAFQVYFLTV